MKRINKGCYKLTNKEIMSMFSKIEWDLSAKGAGKLLMPIAYLCVWAKLALCYVKVRSIRLRVTIAP